MGSIPLPALDVKVPEISNPMDDYMRITQFRNQQKAFQTEQSGRELQLQEANEQHQDDTKWRSAMSNPNWDGTPESLLKNALKALEGSGSRA